QAAYGRASSDRGVEFSGGFRPAQGDRSGDRLAQQSRTDADDFGIGEQAVEKSGYVVESLGAAELEEEDRPGTQAQSVRENTGFCGVSSRYASNGMARLRRKIRPSGVARISPRVSSTSPSSAGPARRAIASLNVSSKGIPKRSSISRLTTTPWQSRFPMTARRRASSSESRAPRTVAAPPPSTAAR